MLLPPRSVLSYVKGYHHPASLIFKTVEWVDTLGLIHFAHGMGMNVLGPEDGWGVVNRGVGLKNMSISPNL